MNKTTKALRYLAGVDDYAQRRDGVGFNKFDAALGQELARLTSLTPEQEHMALAMLQKYRRQLESAGIELPAAESADDKHAADRPEIKVSAGNIYIYFPQIPPEAVRAAIKQCAAWRFRGDLPGKPWEVAATPENAKKISAITGVEIEIGETTPIKEMPKSNVNVSVSSDTIYISLPDPRSRERYVAALKNIGARWRPEMPGKPWATPLSNAAAIVEIFPGVSMPPEVEVAANKQNEIKALSNSAAPTQLAIDGLGGTPYPFQIAGVEFLQATGGRAILADEMGLGKTIQAIMYLHNNPDKLPALVICPASVKLNWRREILKWSSILRPAIAEGKKPSSIPTDANVIIINWDLLAAWEKHIGGIKTIIADEAHYAKNPKAQRTQALRELAKRTQHVILMTGTPVVNRPAELWTLLNIVQPQTWKSFWEYAQRYCAPKNNGFGWDFSGASNLDELHERIKTVVCRRTKAQVLPELPEKRRVIVPVEFDQAARAEYESAIRRYLKSTKGQINALVEIEAARQAAVKGKLAACLDWIKDMLDANGKLVVFAWHTETIRAIAAAFPGISVILTGETSQVERQTVVDRFQNDDDCRLFIGNIRAAGVGITLTAASAVAFVEFAWTPGEMEQAFDRIHRIGQRDAAIAYYLVGENTIDEDIADLLEQKRLVIETIHDGAPHIQDVSILDDLTQRLKARYPDLS